MIPNLYHKGDPLPRLFFAQLASASILPLSLQGGTLPMQCVPARFSEGYFSMKKGVWIGGPKFLEFFKIIINF